LGSVLVTFFLSDKFFTFAGFTLFVIASAVIVTGAIIYYSIVSPKKQPRYSKPFEPATEKTEQAYAKRRQWFLGILSFFEMFEAFLAFFIAFVGFQYLQTTTGVIIGVALTETNALLTLIIIIGAILVVDVARRLWKDTKKNKNFQR
jgi:hypothetical protein